MNRKSNILYQTATLPMTLSDPKSLTTLNHPYFTFWVFVHIGGMSEGDLIR